jgi:hypothetical protein
MLLPPFPGASSPCLSLLPSCCQPFVPDPPPPPPASLAVVAGVTSKAGCIQLRVRWRLLGGPF